VRARRLARPALIAVAFLAAALLRPAPAPSAQSRTPLGGTVTAVTDGDTIRVKLDGGGSEIVRLIGVDSQELDDAREKVRLMAFLAKRFAFTRLYRSRVELLPGPEARDAYGRLLAFVRLPDGELFNLTLVREGYAFAYLKFPFDEALRRELRAAETEARRAGRGLWGREPYPVIAAGDAARRVGDILTVRFRCLRSFRRGGYRILEADGAAFDAVIPLEVYRALPGSLDLEERTIEATGFIETYKDRPQIMIGVPLQLRRDDGKERP